MSGTAIMRALLAATPAVTALVPAKSIIAGIVPQGAVLPAIGVTQISGSEEGTMARNMPNRMIRERVQVTVLAKDYPTMKQIVSAAALGSGVFTGTINGFKVRSILPWGVNPEIPPGDDKIYEQSRDFMVTFVEAN